MKKLQEGLSSKKYFTFDFILQPGREIPEKVNEFNGTYVGPCKIIKCDQYPGWAGQIKRISFYNITSINPAFVYRAPKAEHTGGTIKTAAEQVVAIEMREEIGKAELNFIYEEVNLLDTYRARHKTGVAASKRQKIEEMEDKEDQFAWMDSLDELPSLFKPCILSDIPYLKPLVESRSDLFRLQYIQLLCLYFVGKSNKLAEEQREKIREFDTLELINRCKMLKERPWECAFRESSDPLDPLIQSQYERACSVFSVDVPRHIKLSMRLYYSCMQQMHKENHTCFEWFAEAKKTLNLLEFETVEPLVMAFLEKHALTWIDTKKTRFALKKEYSDAKRICQSLMQVAQTSSHSAVEMRGNLVPIKPPTLTADQEVIARHICSHYLTVVEGLPGTGKTVLIEWVMCRLKNVLLCTLTGMMTKSLRKRMGNRPEAAYTIDYLIAKAFHTPQGRPWLKKFEVLVIDEFSNTATKSLALLLSFLPNLKRIVFVGDHEQIGSISPGDAMGDIKSVYATGGHAFRLTEIKRVEPHLKDLCMAPALMSQKQHRSLCFKPEGPLTLIKGPAKMEPDYIRPVLKGVLEQVFLQSKSLMAHQIIVLKNDVRKELNTICQDICIEKGIIKGRKRYVIDGKDYYIGSKITFTENYNKPTKFTVEKAKKKGQKDVTVDSEPVSNGETGVITHIEQHGSGMHFICFKDDEEGGILKHIICSAKIGVKPYHMDLGYATTSTKVQGREFPMAIFWNNHFTQECWTRAHAYVALSRGKQRVWCVSSADGLYKICDRPNKPRKTVLSHLLKVCADDLMPKSLVTVPFNYSDPKGTYMMLPHTVPCVPTPEDEEEEEEEEQEDL